MLAESVMSLTGPNAVALVNRSCGETNMNLQEIWHTWRPRSICVSRWCWACINIELLRFRSCSCEDSSSILKFKSFEPHRSCVLTRDIVILLDVGKSSAHIRCLRQSLPFPWFLLICGSGEHQAHDVYNLPNLWLFSILSILCLLLLSCFRWWNYHSSISRHQGWLICIIRPNFKMSAWIIMLVPSSLEWRVKAVETPISASANLSGIRSLRVLYSRFVLLVETTSCILVSCSEARKVTTEHAGVLQVCTSFLEMGYELLTDNWYWR